jgi:hypothetical protein
MNPTRPGAPAPLSRHTAAHDPLSRVASGNGQAPQDDVARH